MINLIVDLLAFIMFLSVRFLCDSIILVYRKQYIYSHLTRGISQLVLFNCISYSILDYLNKLNLTNHLCLVILLCGIFWIVFDILINKARGFNIYYVGRVDLFDRFIRMLKLNGIFVVIFKIGITLGIIGIILLTNLLYDFFSR